MVFLISIIYYLFNNKKCREDYCDKMILQPFCNLSRLNSKGGKFLAIDVEKRLIRKLKKGNEKAYIELLDIYGNRLLKTCYLILKDESDAEDVVQETFLKVFRQIDSFKGNSSLYTWIYRIALNLCKDKMKARKEFIIYEDTIESDDRVEDTVINDINREILREKLSKLNPIYNEVLILFYFEELSIKAICEILEEKEGTIKSRLSRGRILLKDAIEKGGELIG